LKINHLRKITGLGLIIVVLAVLFWQQPFIQSVNELLNGLKEPRLLAIYNRTLLIALSATAFSLVLGLALAYFLFETKLPGVGVFRHTYYWPLILPPYFLATAWLTWLGDFGLLKNPALKINSEVGAVFLFTLYLTPLIVIAAANVLQNSETSLKEAALLMGTHGRYFWRIWLPRVLPAALGGGFLVFVIAVNNYSIPSILGINTVSTEVYAEFGAFYSFQRALVKMIPVFLVFLFLFLALKNKTVKGFSNLNLNLVQPICDERPFTRWGGFSCLLVYALASFLLPVSGLIIQVRSFENLRKSISLAWGQTLFSFWFSVLSALLILIPALCLAYIFVRQKKQGILPALATLLILPPVFAGILLIFLLNRPALNFIYQSGALLFLGYLARFLPLIFILLIPAVNAIPKELEDASLLTGAGPWKTRWNIFLPLVTPALFLAWGIGFLLCHGEAECSILLYPPGSETVSMRILSLLHYGTGPIVNGLVLFQLILLGLTVLFCNYLSHLPTHRKVSRQNE
jgi:iron(III) transport system permease protein